MGLATAIGHYGQQQRAQCGAVYLRERMSECRTEPRAQQEDLRPSDRLAHLDGFYKEGRDREYQVSMEGKTPSETTATSGFKISISIHHLRCAR